MKDNKFKTKRNLLIFRDHARGMTHRDIAKKYNISHTRSHQIVAKVARILVLQSFTLEEIDNPITFQSIVDTLENIDKKHE